MIDRRRTTLAIMTMAVTGALLLSGCISISGDAGDSRYLVLGDPKVSGLDDWPGAFKSPFSTFDFDGDGTKEILAQSTDGKVYVFHGESGRALAVLPTKYPPSWYVDQVLNGVEAGVLAPGEAPSIVAVNHAGYLAAWRFDPQESDEDRFVFEKSWEKRAAGCESNPSVDGTAVLADLTGDGHLEITVQAEEVGLYAFKGDGSKLWQQCWGGGNASPTVGDLDGDGGLEVVFASDAGFVSVLDGASGEPQWTFDAGDGHHGVDPGSITVAPTIAELDGKAPREVLFVARHAPVDDPDRFEDFHAGIFAVHQKQGAHEGELVWSVQPEWANPMSYTHLVVDDVDQDGKPDVFGMDWNTIGHRPGDWERLGPAHAFRLTAEGEVVWQREIDAFWSNDDVAIADLDGDGERELLATGPRGDNDGIWGLSLDRGGAKAHHAAEGWKVMGGPRLLSLYGDDQMQMAFGVVPADAEDENERGAILVYDLGVPFDAVQYEHVTK